MLKIAVVTGILCLLALLFLRLLKRQKREKELRQKAGDKLREEALDRALTGGKRKGAAAAGSRTVPFEVSYDQQGRDDGSSREIDLDRISGMMLQVTEYSELSSKKYMFHMKEQIHIGSGADNQIVLSDQRVARCQCIIYEGNGYLYLKNMDAWAKVVVCRGKKTAVVDAKPIRLRSGDRVKIADNTYELQIIE